MVLKKPQSVGKKFKIKNYYAQTLIRRKAIVTNVKNMKCTGLKAVSYPDTRHLIKGSTVQISTDTRIFYI